jgi:hypothetical protein
MLINRAVDCSIAKYKRCKFDNDFTALGDEPLPVLQEAFQKIQVEYIDAAGIDLPEVKLMARVKEMECRNIAVEMLLGIQEQILPLINEPHQEAIKELKKHGVTLKWNGNVDDFKKQLQRAHLNEVQQKSKLDIRKKELSDYQKTKGTDVVVSDGFETFELMLINLATFGYRIDEETTSIYKLGLMYKQYAQTMQQKKNAN